MGKSFFMIKALRDPPQNPNHRRLICDKSAAERGRRPVEGVERRPWEELYLTAGAQPVCFGPVEGFHGFFIPSGGLMRSSVLSLGHTMTSVPGTAEGRVDRLGLVGS